MNGVIVVHASHRRINQLNFVDWNENAPFWLALEVGVVLVGTVVISRVGPQLDAEILTVLPDQTPSVPNRTALQVGTALKHHSASQLYFVNWGR